MTLESPKQGSKDPGIPRDSPGQFTRYLVPALKRRISFNYWRKKSKTVNIMLSNEVKISENKLQFGIRDLWDIFYLVGGSRKDVG